MSVSGPAAPGSGAGPNPAALDRADDAIRSVLIVGRGIAGWMTAAALPHALPHHAGRIATLPSLVSGGIVERINDRKSYTSWSVGALYEVSPNTSVFARASRGGRFNADRRVLGGNFNADGSLNVQGDATALHFLNQQEAGLKQRGGPAAATRSRSPAFTRR